MNDFKNTAKISYSSHS